MINNRYDLLTKGYVHSTKFEVVLIEISCLQAEASHTHTHTCHHHRIDAFGKESKTDEINAGGFFLLYYYSCEYRSWDLLLSEITATLQPWVNPGRSLEWSCPVSVVTSGGVSGWMQRLSATRSELSSSDLIWKTKQVAKGKALLLAPQAIFTYLAFYSI